MPWGVEYMSLKKLISILSTTRRKTNSHNSTARSSQISNNEESFHKEKTPVLIISANNNKEENNDDMILQLKKSVNKENNNNRIKINKMNFEENENNNNIKQINPINLKNTQNSERKILNPSKLEIDTGINNEYKEKQQAWYHEQISGYGFPSYECTAHAVFSFEHTASLRKIRNKKQEMSCSLSVIGCRSRDPVLSSDN